jgi:hypothetical protein
VFLSVTILNNTLPLIPAHSCPHLTMQEFPGSSAANVCLLSHTCTRYTNRLAVACTESSLDLAPIAKSLLNAAWALSLGRLQRPSDLGWRPGRGGGGVLEINRHTECAAVKKTLRIRTRNAATRTEPRRHTTGTSLTHMPYEPTPAWIGVVFGKYQNKHYFCELRDKSTLPPHLEPQACDVL